VTPSKSRPSGLKGRASTYCTTASPESVILPSVAYNFPTVGRELGLATWPVRCEHYEDTLVSLVAVSGMNKTAETVFLLIDH